MSKYYDPFTEMYFRTTYIFLARSFIANSKKLQKQTELWIEQLRAEGFKAAHPNDGWVDRQKNIINFAYPDFNDDAYIGDKVMLGRANDPSSHRSIRLVEEAPYPWEKSTKEKFKFVDIPNPFKTKVMENTSMIKTTIWWKKISGIIKNSSIK